MPIYCCEYCDYNTKSKRSIIRHMNNKKVCRNQKITITKEIANEILSKLDAQDILKNSSNEVFQELLLKNIIEKEEA